MVFKDPGGWLSGAESVGPPNAVTKLMAKIGLYPSGGHLVKRVIGVAGDTIKCCDDKGRIMVNGVAARREGLRPQGRRRRVLRPDDRHCDWTAGPVPEGTIFVMGDNRSHSADSTVHMCRASQTDCVPGDEFVPVDLVVGKVFVLLWPRQHFRWLHRPDTFADVPDAAVAGGASLVSDLPRGADRPQRRRPLRLRARAASRTGWCRSPAWTRPAAAPAPGRWSPGAAILPDTQGRHRARAWPTPSC